MSRVFDDWWHSLTGEEQQAWEEAKRVEEDVLLEEHEAEERARLQAEPELPFPPIPARVPADLEDCPF